MPNSAIEHSLEKDSLQTIYAYRNRLLRFQAVLLMVISLFAGTIFSWDMARATLMGGAITMLLTIHMAWRLQKLNNHANSQVMLYIGAVERFVLVLVLFASGFSLLILEPLGMITGFIAIQLVQLIIRQQ